MLIFPKPVFLCYKLSIPPKCRYKPGKAKFSFKSSKTFKRTYIIHDILMTLTVHGMLTREDPREKHMNPNTSKKDIAHP